MQRTFPHWRSDPARASQWQDNGISYLEFRDWRAQQTSFESVASWNWTSRPLRTDLGVELASVLFASASLLEALGVRPQLGRNFRPLEEGRGAFPVALISDGEWHTRFGGAADVLGRRLELNGVAHEIVGVLPRAFHLVRLRQTPGIWVPAGTLPWDTARDNFNYNAMGRLKPGVSQARAQEETNRIFQFDQPKGESRSPFRPSARVHGPGARTFSVVAVRIGLVVADHLCQRGRVIVGRGRGSGFRGGSPLRAGRRASADPATIADGATRTRACRCDIGPGAGPLVH